MPVIRCCLDDLVLDVGHNSAELSHDILHGLGEIDHEVDVDGVVPPLGDELDSVGDGRSRRQDQLFSCTSNRRPFYHKVNLLLKLIILVLAITHL